MIYAGINGEVIPADQVTVSIMDHGLLYGMGLFETFRTYGGTPFLLDRHVERLIESCRLIGIQYEPDIAHLRSWISRLLEANGWQEAYIRFTVTAGADVLGLPGGVYKEPQQLILAKPLPEIPDSVYRQGKALQLLKTPRNTPETQWRLKSLHYMNNIMAKRELQSYPEACALQAEGCMLTGSGELAEGIVSNLFFIKDDILCTPDLGTGILPGITRAVVMELAREQGITVSEGRYRWQDLLDAQEVFSTGSVQELMPITTLLAPEASPVIVGHGLAGPLTEQLRNAYRRLTGRKQDES
ncbi:aminotransferase class IV [Paenibacillus lemnae]|uniref:4-amino-4-deoxychorismate lyase n=1 Tax=Paenibacillus lemnae TaxID=1330551 RepID=A0A848MCK8_PAELE|nr:aminotransferase class IV [Paenibacillus lemnae]NMO97772.1 4-amino-4-deoxychorismate lyase [Paenibacillus lemnae]